MNRYIQESQDIINNNSYNFIGCRKIGNCFISKYFDNHKNYVLEYNLKTKKVYNYYPIDMGKLKRNRYILVEGMDGSGITHICKFLMQDTNFKKYPINNESNDNSNDWWKSERVCIEKRFEHYLECNIRESILINKMNCNVIHVKGFITTLITHSYFLHVPIERHLKLALAKGLIIPDTIIFIYCNDAERKRRLINRNKLTEFHRLTTNKEFCDYYKNCLVILKEKIPSIQIVDNTVLDNTIEHRLYKMLKL